MMKSIKWIGVALVLGLSSPAVHVEAAGCSAGDIAAAKALAGQVLALSKTNPSAALAIAQDVAASKPKCFQVAFGAFLDGKGVASTKKKDGKKDKKDKKDKDKDEGEGNGGGNGNGGDDDGCKRKKNCPPSRS